MLLLSKQQEEKDSYFLESKCHSSNEHGDLESQIKDSLLLCSLCEVPGSSKPENVPLVTCPNNIKRARPVGDIVSLLLWWRKQVLEWLG